MAIYDDILNTLADSNLQPKKPKAKEKDTKKRISGLLSEVVSKKPKPQHSQVLQLPSNGLITLNERRNTQIDLLVKLTDEDRGEPLFECYEDYVAYMISDEREFGEYSTFMSSDEYQSKTGRSLNEDFDYDYESRFESETNRYRQQAFQNEYVEYMRKEKQQKQYEQQNQQRRQEQRQEYAPPRSEDSLYDRINRNKSRLLDQFGLSNTATLDDVKKAYRQQMLRYHPDKAATKDEQTQREYTQKAQVLNESYKKLLNQDFV